MSGDPSGRSSAFVAVIIGRPNVGKSSLFNCLAGRRDALVADEAGLTRDLRFAPMAVSDKQQDEDVDGEAAAVADISWVLVDTGGLQHDAEPVPAAAAALAWQQAQKAHLVLLVTDAAVGPTGFDEELNARLRRESVRVLLVANKIDGVSPLQAQADFAPLGMDELLQTSARTGRGIARLRARMLSIGTELAASTDPDTLTDAEEDGHSGDSIVLAGRPNAGKSTLMNYLCNSERSLVSDQPGTTRDEISAVFDFRGRRYELVDTAGVQKKWRTAPAGQALSAARALARMSRTTAVVLLVDAVVGLTEQDQRLLGHSLRTGRAVLLAWNKADLLSPRQRRQLLEQFERMLAFASFVPHCFISAQRGKGIDKMLELVWQLVRDGERSPGTAQLNRILRQLVEQHPPPMRSGRAPKLRYAHPLPGTPPQIRVLGTACERVPESYRRYLEKGFGEALGGLKSPVRVQLESVVNPYVRTGNRPDAADKPSTRKSDTNKSDTNKSDKGDGQLSG